MQFSSLFFFHVTKFQFLLSLSNAFYNTISHQFDHEWISSNGNNVFKNEMNLQAKQTGIVGELAHVHSFEKGKLSSGYRISNTSISNDLSNLLGNSHYDVNYLTQYLYTEYSGKKYKLTYRLGIGVTNIQNKTAETIQNDWAPTPKLVLGYDLGKNQSLRFSSQYTSQSPFAAALSSNVVQVVPNIVQKGNPNLQSQHLFRNNLIYSYDNKYFDLNANVFYNLVDKYFAQFFLLDTDTGGYALTYENGDFIEKGLQISGSIKPFGSDIFVLKVWIQPVSMRLKSQDGKEFKNNFVRNNFSLSSQYKSFGINYQFNFPVFQLNGAFLNRDENQHHLFINYKLKNWTFISGIYWLGTPSVYKTVSLPGSLVTYSRHNQIFNNKNMVGLV